jgi:hypothetical protein
LGVRAQYQQFFDVAFFTIFGKLCMHARAEGLVESQQEEGKRTKYFYLSNLGRRIFTAVTEAARVEPEGKLEDWQIEKLLAILCDSRIDKKFRKSYASVFDTLSHQSPIQLINYSGVRELIQEIVANAPADEISKELNRSVPVLLSHALQHQIWRDWVVKKLYPILIKNIGSENARARVRAIRQVVQVATFGPDPKLASDVRKRLLKLWFSDETDASGNFGNEVREQLVLVCLDGGSTNAQAIFDEARNKAADENPHTKEKAETLLVSLKECILPKK